MTTNYKVDGRIKLKLAILRLSLAFARAYMHTCRRRDRHTLLRICFCHADDDIERPQTKWNGGDDDGDNINCCVIQDWRAEEPWGVSFHLRALLRIAKTRVNMILCYIVCCAGARVAGVIFFNLNHLKEIQILFVFVYSPAIEILRRQHRCWWWWWFVQHHLCFTHPWHGRFFIDSE